MDPLIQFFIGVGRLKTLKRPGWVLRGVKNPETVAEHSFRVLILSWIFGKKRSLNIRRVLKLSLVHSLSAVYIDYISPYEEILGTKSKKELIKRYPALVLRAPVTQKGKIVKQRYEQEERAVKKLIEKLPEATKYEILYLWRDFQQKSSKEAKFVYVIDKLENLIQAIEYKNQLGKKFINPFILQIREITSDKQILNFVDAMDDFFTKGEASVKKVKDRNLVKFVLEVGKLKTIPRKGWVIRGVKNPESVASHLFRSALMAWIFSSRRRIDQEVVIVMAATHDLFTAVLGDVTYYDESLKNVKDKERRKKIIESLPWLGFRVEKELFAKKRLHSEVKALDKVLKLLPHHLRHELKYFWLEHKVGASREGKFLSQVDRIEALLQAIQYQAKDKKIPISSFWLQLKELLEDPLLTEFVENIDKFYFRKNR